MTVSRVINNHPSVKATTRRKVLAAITALGYQQNEAARLLKGRRARTIGLIVPDLSDIFFATCAHTVQQIARAHDLMTLIVASERDADLEVKQAELMASRMVSGLLIVTSSKDGDERLRRLQVSGLPIVAFDRPLAGLESDSVIVENRAGAEAAVEHLIAHGHKRIACAGYDQEVYTINERIRGYKYRMQLEKLKPQVCLWAPDARGCAALDKSDSCCEEPSNCHLHSESPHLGLCAASTYRTQYKNPGSDRIGRL